MASTNCFSESFPRIPQVHAGKSQTSGRDKHSCLGISLAGTGPVPLGVAPGQGGAGGVSQQIRQIRHGRAGQPPLSSQPEFLVGGAWTPGKTPAGCEQALTLCAPTAIAGPALQPSLGQDQCRLMT